MSQRHGWVLGGGVKRRRGHRRPTGPRARPGDDPCARLKSQIDPTQHGRRSGAAPAAQPTAVGGVAREALHLP